MHPNPAFRTTDTISALSFASDIGFGALAINDSNGPLMSHIPFLIDGDQVRFHLVRSNPIARIVDSETPAKLAVVGPHGYVSPDWYGVENQVPTWNYVAIHLVGDMVPAPDEELQETLDLLSEKFETRLHPKPVWRSDKVDAGALLRMNRMIQPFRLKIKDVQSTFKLSQNKPVEARLSAAENVETNGLGADTAHLAALMKSAIHEE